MFYILGVSIGDVVPLLKLVVPTSNDVEWVLGKTYLSKLFIGNLNEEFIDSFHPVFLLFRSLCCYGTQTD